MDAPLFWVLVAAMLAASLFLLRQSARAFWHLRTVTDTPTARVQSAPQGYVELAGLARPHQGELRAKLTGAACLWYRYRIEERRGSGRNERWATVEQGESEEPFILADPSGQCLVEPKGAQLRPRRRRRWEGRSRNPASPRAVSWLAVFFGGHRCRFTEERIESGEPLYCLGRFETPRRGPEERERLHTALLRTWKRDPARLASFDTNGDGRIDAIEWERAQTYAARLAERSELCRSREPVLARLGATGDPRHPFVISAYTEDELVTTLGWQALGFALGFLGLAVALGYSLTVRLGGGP